MGSGAQLQGADLNSAQLQAADLQWAQLQGAELNSAQLQGADLGLAQLQGADLNSAQLQGADLITAQLQGADLSLADLTDSDLVSDAFFRANIADANLSTATVEFIPAKAILLDKRLVGPELINPSEVDGWIAAATQFVAGERKDLINQRFDRLKPHFQSGAEDDADAAKWAELARQSQVSDPNGTHHRRRLATFLGDLACGPHSSDGAPYVARGLMGQRVPWWHVSRSLFGETGPGRLAALGDQLGAVRDRMKAGRKDPDKCPGVAGFTEDDWKQLDSIKLPMSKPAFELPPAGRGPSPW